MRHLLHLELLLIGEPGDQRRRRPIEPLDRLAVEADLLALAVGLLHHLADRAQLGGDRRPEFLLLGGQRQRESSCGRCRRRRADRHCPAWPWWRPRSPSSRAGARSSVDRSRHAAEQRAGRGRGSGTAAGVGGSSTGSSRYTMVLTLTGLISAGVAVAEASCEGRGRSSTGAAFGRGPAWPRLVSAPAAPDRSPHWPRGQSRSLALTHPSEIRQIRVNFIVSPTLPLRQSAGSG